MSMRRKFSYVFGGKLFKEDLQAWLAEQNGEFSTLDAVRGLERHGLQASIASTLSALIRLADGGAITKRFIATGPGKGQYKWRVNS